jgi:hypothetical protein
MVADSAWGSGCHLQRCHLQRAECWRGGAMDDFGRAVGVLICLSGIWVLFRTVSRTVKTFRWIARILSVLIILFWVYMFVGSFLESRRGGHPSGPLSMHDRMGLTLMFVWLLGLALAWKWELAGASLTLTVFLIEAFFINWRVVGFGILPPITALLFLLCWWMGRQSCQVKHDA